VLKRVATALVFVVHALVNMETPRGLARWWRQGFQFETVPETFGALYREGLIVPVRDEDGELVQRGGKIVWRATENGQEVLGGTCSPIESGSRLDRVEATGVELDE
jgi:hypothetical protein